MYIEEDDGTTTDALVIAKAIELKAKKAGKSRSWDDCYSEAFTEATKRGNASADAQVSALNANPEALAVIEAAKEIGPVDLRLAEAEARVDFSRAGYPNAEAVILAKARMAEQQKERAKSIAAVARRILARTTSGAVQASAAAAGTGAATSGTFTRVDVPKAKPKAKVEYFIPGGCTPFEAASLAMKNQLPVRTVASRNAVQVAAETIQADARAAGDECSWEMAVSKAHAKIERARKSGVMK